MQDAQSILKEYFGYDSFRPGQEQLVQSILAGQDTVGVMPTGAGKSICYQVPAMLLPGVSVIISPLISLMKDQVEALGQVGVPALFINSSLSGREYFAALDDVRAGRCKLLYAAPERLQNEGFLQALEGLAIPLVTVDEAHCVSQWGQDFRPGYLKIEQFIASLPVRPAVAAFTATATQQVTEDIVRLLALREPMVLTTGFDRQNLFFGVEKHKNKERALLDFLRAHSKQCGIVYCATRKGVEEVCAALVGAGHAATRYHAGLGEEERRHNQEDFLYDRSLVMVATNAFGMGIDKSNVSFVIHYNMPKNIESYYQEAGRAGRDGSDAECILYYAGKDVITNQFLIEKTQSNEELDAETAAQVRAADHERLRRMTFYCSTDGCLRAFILRYFGQKAPDWCGACSNCTGEFEEHDVTVDAQKILSSIRRAGERFGVSVNIDILRGNANERVQSWGLDRLSTFGIMADVSPRFIREEINFLTLGGYLRAEGDQFPVLRLGSAAREVLFGEKKLIMRLPKARPKPEKAARGAPAGADADAPGRPVLFERLRALRARIAAAESVPAYIVFTDAALREMSTRMPCSEEEFLDVPGVGNKKLVRYGEVFMNEIRLYLEEC